MAKKPEIKRMIHIKVDGDELCIKTFSRDAEQLVKRIARSLEYGDFVNIGEAEMELNLIIKMMLSNDHPKRELVERELRQHEEGKAGHIHILVKPSYDPKDVKRYIEERWQEEKWLNEKIEEALGGKDEAG